MLFYFIYYNIKYNIVLTIKNVLQTLIKNFYNMNAIIVKFISINDLNS